MSAAVYGLSSKKDGGDLHSPSSSSSGKGQKAATVPWGSPTAVGAASGCLAGLVAITPGAGMVSQMFGACLSRLRSLTKPAEDYSTFYLVIASHSHVLDLRLPFTRWCACSAADRRAGNPSLLRHSQEHPQAGRGRSPGVPANSRRGGDDGHPAGWRVPPFHAGCLPFSQSETAPTRDTPVPITNLSPLASKLTYLQASLLTQPRAARMMVWRLATQSSW